MKYTELKPGHRYFTTWNNNPDCTAAPVTFICIDRIFNDNDATITVESYGRLYTATAYQMKSEAK